MGCVFEHDDGGVSDRMAWKLLYVVLIYDFVIACFLLEADDVRFESDEGDVTTQHDEGTHLPAFPFVKFDSLLSPGE